MKRQMWQMRPLWALLSATLLTACSGTLGPASVDGVRPVVGGELPGAQGLTTEDQNRIDDTVARGCAAGIYSPAECDRHTVASFERRQDLTITSELVLDKLG